MKWTIRVVASCTRQQNARSSFIDRWESFFVKKVFRKWKRKKESVPPQQLRYRTNRSSTKGKKYPATPLKHPSTSQSTQERFDGLSSLVVTKHWASSPAASATNNNSWCSVSVATSVTTITVLMIDGRCGMVSWHRCWHRVWMTIAVSGLSVWSSRHHHTWRSDHTVSRCNHGGHDNGTDSTGIVHVEGFRLRESVGKI